MEFKKIDSLSIAECCDLLGISQKDLPEGLAQVQTSVVDKSRKLVVERLTELLEADKRDFEDCKTIGMCNTYLEKWPDGLWRDEVLKLLNRLKMEREDSNFYDKNRRTIAGCRAYLKKYPNGLFSSEVQHILRQKVEKRRICRISLALLLIISGVVFCFDNYQPVSYLNLTGNGTFNKMGGEVVFSYSTDAALENIRMRKSEDWVKYRDEGRGDLLVSVSKNLGEQRTAVFTIDAYSTFFGIQCGCISKQIVISQDSGLPTFLDVNTTEILFDKYGNCKTSNNFMAKTDGCELEIGVGGDSLYVDTVPSWFTASKNVETDVERISANVSVTADLNKYDERFGYITVEAGNMMKWVKVCQESGLATKFLVETTTLRMAEEGTGEGMCYPIKVETDGTWWYVDKSPSWLTAYADLNDKRLEVSVGTNTGKERTGTIIIKSNNGDWYEIDVTQEGDPTDFSSESDRVRFGASGGDKYIAIRNNSNKSLSVADTESWLTCSVMRANEIYIYCYENNDFPRDGTVTVKCGGESLRISVEQNGWSDCSKCDDGYKSCSNGVWDPSAMSFVHSKTRYVYDNLFNGHWVVDKCPLCDGTGKIKCSACDGKGKVEDYY